MMSSNSFSTDPGDDFPEVDDYSDVDDLDAVAAALAAELRSGATSSNGDHAPEAPVEPPALDPSADPTSPEQLASALAEQVGLDLNDRNGVDLADDGSITAGPVDLGEEDLADEGDAHPVTARAGWFPPVSEGGELQGSEAGPAGQDNPDGSAERSTVGDRADDGSGPDEPEYPEPPAQPVMGSSDGDIEPETFDRPPSSPPIERAPLMPTPASEPPREAPAARVEPDGGEPVGHPIDQVAVRKLGGFNFLSVGQWSALPRDERARLLKGGLVMFLFEGEEVATRPALLWLQQMARSGAPGPEDPPTRRRGR